MTLHMFAFTSEARDAFSIMATALWLAGIDTHPTPEPEGHVMGHVNDTAHFFFSKGILCVSLDLRAAFTDVHLRAAVHKTY